MQESRPLTNFFSTYVFKQVSVSVPTWNSVYFLRAADGAANYRFGVFGFTGSQTRLGYRFPITYVFGYRALSGISD